MGLAIQDISGQIWSINKGNNTIDIYNRLGTKIKTIDPNADPEVADEIGVNPKPLSIAVLNNKVAIHYTFDDNSNGYVVLYNLNGTKTDDYEFDGSGDTISIDELKGISTAYNNQIFLIDKDKVALYDSNGEAVDKAISFRDVPEYSGLTETESINDISVTAPYEELVVEPKPVIIDRGNNRLLIINSSTELISIGGLDTSLPTAMNSPNDVVITSNGIFVTDQYNNQIKKFNLLGTYQASLGTAKTAGSSNNEFNSPYAILDVNNKLWVSDYYNNRIQILTQDTLQHDATIGGLSNPSIMAKLGQYVWCYNLGSKKLILINTSTKSIDHEITTNINGIKAMQPLGNDRMMVVNATGTKDIAVFSSDGDYLTSFGKNKKMGQPVDACYNPDRDSIYVADYKGNKLLEFSAIAPYSYIGDVGSKGSTLGQFMSPNKINYYKGSIYIVEYKNKRVQEFNASTGEAKFIINDDSTPMNNPSSMSVPTVSE